MSKDLSKKYKKPKKCISVKQARELQEVWCDTRTPEIDKCLGFEDTREFWWSVEELLEYINYVKEESTKQGIDNPGIRIYFGAYPKGKCEMKKGYSTVFLAPTEGPNEETLKGGDSANNNYDIDAYNRGGSGRPPKVY